MKKGLYKLKKKRSAARTIGRILRDLLLVLVLLAAGGLVWLTVNAWYPEAEESLDVTRDAIGQSLELAEETDAPDLTVMSWNIGYGGLGENADFFMDGGTSVISTSEEGVENNIAAICEEIRSVSPDVLFLQEVDEDSKMSHYVNERQEITDSLNGYDGTFAYTYKAKYVPVPLPVTIGREQTGMMVFSRYSLQDATRIALPDAFPWPVNTAYLKRALVVSRIDLEGSDRQLVLIDLHLEAYDSGSAKEEQTRILQDLIYQEIEKGNYVIAGGDFNQTFSNADVSAYPLRSPDNWKCGTVDVSEYDDRVTFLMDTATPTCRSLDQPLAGADADNFQYYCVDGFIVSSNIEVISVETQDLKFVNSDHNPVVLKVNLKKD